MNLMEKYRARLNDARQGPINGRSKEQIEEVLKNPQTRLERPLLIESARLGERLYLVANQGQAREIEESGGICYLPEEVKTLLVRSTGMDEETLKDYLVKIHTTKKLFPGAMIKSEGR